MGDLNEILVNADGSIDWPFDGKKIVLPKGSVDSILADEKRNILFVLIAGDKYPVSLNLYSHEGGLIKSLLPPEGFGFYYLTKHPELGVAVVCVSDQKVDNWHDWHFGYDDQKLELFRHCPAY